ncbi:MULTISPECIES: hypothetical protein [Streptomyces]|uniref:hypothetical protein n=1 Tax=Streptomyces TaxID=1883 RepID=UPI0031FA2A35
MRTRAAVLRRVSPPRPCSETRPVEVEELELGAPRAGEVLGGAARAPWKVRVSRPDRGR